MKRISLFLIFLFAPFSHIFAQTEAPSDADGLFGKYFQRMVKPCSLEHQAVIGFKITPFGDILCSGIEKLLEKIPDGTTVKIWGDAGKVNIVINGSIKQTEKPSETDKDAIITREYLEEYIKKYTETNLNIKLTNSITGKQCREVTINYDSGRTRTECYWFETFDQKFFISSNNMNLTIMNLPKKIVLTVTDREASDWPAIGTKYTFCREVIEWCLSYDEEHKIWDYNNNHLWITINKVNEWSPFDELNERERWGFANSFTSLPQGMSRNERKTWMVLRYRAWDYSSNSGWVSFLVESFY